MESVSSPNYPQGVLNAEPVSRATADGAIAAAINALTRAAATLEGGARWPIMRDAPSDYRYLLDGLVRDVGMAKANPRLTPAAKMQDARTIAAAWRPRAEEVVTDLEVRVRDWKTDIERRARPNPPIADRGHLEAALMNARSDARMVLDASEDAELPDRLAELARDDEVMRYLILGTDWPSTYFRARDAKSAPMLWPPVRRRLLAEFLDAGGVTALERLEGIEHARRAAIALRAGHELTISNNRAYFEQAEGR